ncbi:MAG: hypothetical protein HXY46_13340 [Syntrophaceae bacterium]|nr:hypothetical protein [Syntrophaceae bacterium]
MKTGTKIVLISILAVVIAMFLFIIYQLTALYHYKSVVLDQFPVEPPSKEVKRFFEIEKEKKEQAIEMAKKYAREKDELYGDAQNLVDKVKGDVRIIGWDADKAIHVGQLYDSERFGVRLLDDFRASMETIKRGLVKLKDLGFLIEGSPASELILENDPKYFASRIKRLKEEYVSIRFYLLPRGKGVVKAKELSEGAKKVVDEIDKEIEKASGLINHFYHYGDSLYLVTFRYQTQDDRVKNRTQGWFFEVDLDSKTVRDASLDKELGKKYQIPLKLKSDQKENTSWKKK